MRGPTSLRGKVPAVVVGGTLNALGVVRSLARARVPVLLLETTRRCPATWSRHCTYVRVPSLEGEALIEALVRLASGLGCEPVLLLTTDESVLAVSAFRHRIEPLYRIDLPAAAMVRSLADKTEFHALAEREGFAVPRGRVLLGTADFDRMDELEPPLVLKPADKTLVLAGVVDRAVRAQTLGQARAAAAHMLSHAPALIVQEWVDGPDTEIFFTLFSCGREGELVGIFPGRKLVCSPPAVGSTAVCVAAPEVAEDLYRQTRHFVERVGYRGIGSLEFKRDRRTGGFLIIEPTVGRTDWQEEIATLCGLNIPVLAYRIALGTAVPPACDVTFLRYAWRSDRQFSVPRSTVAPRTRVVDGYFRWSDPLPATYYYGYERLAVRVWRRTTRLTRKTLAHTMRAD
ncbi:MAG: carboxylate--amine ligase [Steroidobacteraceae bacterium]